MAVTKRILVVDDDPEVHQLLAAALESADRRIEDAYDGLEGLRRVEAASYDLVLSDVNMPGLDGLALLERIRQIRPETKVVLMTVANTPESVMSAISQQAFSYFSKPFTIDAVSEMAARALESRPAEDDIEVFSARPEWLGIRVRCKVETADRILQFVRELSTDLPAGERDNIATAFREILLNAIEHGGGSDPNQKVTVEYIRTQRALLYYVRDPGKGFSFKTLPHAAVSNPLNSPFEHTQVREEIGMRPGGFGILMTRQLVDELIYNEAGNEVLLIKYLS
jgi:CheY-like chemotaxis protein